MKRLVGAAAIAVLLGCPVEDAEENGASAEIHAARWAQNLAMIATVRIRFWGPPILGHVFDPAQTDLDDWARTTQ